MMTPKSLSLPTRIQQTLIILLVGGILMTLLAPTQSVFADRRQNQDQSLNLSPRAFVYQGQLKEGSAPANGTYDFQFALYTAQTGGEALNVILHEGLALTNGLFKVELDFGGAAFNAEESWLEIAVRPGDSAEPYTVLSPRQKLTPTPYAIFAQAESWNLIGVPVGVVGRQEIGVVDDIMTDEKSVNERGVKDRASSKDAKTPAAETAEAAALVGTQNYIAKFDSSGNATVNSIMFDNGTNVGIGTTSPRHRLGITSGPTWTSAGWGGAIELGNGTAIGWQRNNASQRFGLGHTNGGFYIFRTDADPGSAGGSPNYDFVINDSGNVGIGTSNPGTAKLAVMNGNVGIGTTTPSFQLDVVGTVLFRRTNGETGLTVNPSGNVGIGTPNPGTAKLAVMDGNIGIGTGNPAGPVHILTTGTPPSGLSGTENGLLLGVQSTSGYKWIQSYGGALSLNPVGNNVGIGTTTPANRLSVLGNADVTGSVGIGIPQPMAYLHIQGTDKNKLRITDTSPSGRSWSLRTGQLVAGDIIFSDQTADLSVWRVMPGNNGAFVIDNRNVGIGTDNPQAKLDVVGTTRTGVLEITGGSDLAEPFEVSEAEAITPGMVVTIDPNQPGRLRLADKIYDRTVAGIVSGANGINPGLTMKQQGTAADGSLPVALTGRVYCWADASNGPIKPGDLLTTSDTPGHAMKVKNHKKAQGAIIGKAMGALTQGRGMVLVLVTLQ
jgi:hypothetical protein